MEYITPDANKNEKVLSNDEQFEMSLLNVINNSYWQLTDILCCTPPFLNHILEAKQKYMPFDINPKTIIIDEFDEILQNPLMY